MTTPARQPTTRRVLACCGVLAGWGAVASVPACVLGAWLQVTRMPPVGDGWGSLLSTAIMMHWLGLGMFTALTLAASAVALLVMAVIWPRAEASNGEVPHDDA